MTPPTTPPIPPPSADDLERDALADYKATWDTHQLCWIRRYVAERGRAEAAEAVAAQRVSGDPDVRDLLLCEFGTTDPDLLRDVMGEQRNAIAAARERIATLEAALRRLLNAVDESPGAIETADAINNARRLARAGRGGEG